MDETLFRVQVVRALVPGVWWFCEDRLFCQDLCDAWTAQSEVMAKGMAVVKSRQFPEWRWLVVAFYKTVNVDKKMTSGYSNGEEIAKLES